MKLNFSMYLPTHNENVLISKHKIFIVLSFFLFSIPYFLPVVSQDYITRVHEIDVILGNSGLLKCEIPSFVIDFVTVVSWISDQGIDYFSKTQSGNFQDS